jgi:hypothetical protein
MVMVPPFELIGWFKDPPGGTVTTIGVPLDVMGSYTTRTTPVVFSAVVSQTKVGASVGNSSDV